MASRCAALCRAVSQCELKNSGCSWVAALPWRSASAKGSGSAAASSGSAQAGSEAGTYTYGYDLSEGASHHRD
eukprot:11892749-Alexandrium_andersonii.AAC.1